MVENAIIAAVLATGFVLLILFIRFFRFNRPPKAPPVIVYYKLDFIKRKISVISPAVFSEEIKILSERGFQLIYLEDLESLTSETEGHESGYFLIAFNEAYEKPIQEAMPLLIQQQVSIIIFLPVSVSDAEKKYRKEEPMKLNNIFFYAEVQKYFQLHPTK